MSEPCQDKGFHSLLTDVARANREVVRQLSVLNENILEANRMAKIGLGLESDRLRDRMLAVFVGKDGPKRQLVELYLSVGKGKTRKELIEEGFPDGTVFRYCNQLVADMLLQTRGVRPGGESVLAYTLVEELTQLSKHLKALIEASP